MIKIHIMNGPEKGKVIECESDQISIGRIEDNDIQLNDKTISRKHLRILRKDSKYYVQDLNSSNGTYVNGDQISNEDFHPLGDYAEIGFGHKEAVSLKWQFLVFDQLRQFLGDDS